MTDKERILFAILRGAHLRLSHFGPYDPKKGEAGIPIDPKKPHLAHYRDVQVGDLVFCTDVRGIFDWLIGWAVQPTNDGWLLREIGTDRRCNCTNMDFVPIVGLHPEDILEGKAYRFMHWARQAVSACGDDNRRYDHVRYDGDTGYVGIREKWEGRSRPGPDAIKSVPFEIPIPLWEKVQSIKQLTKVLVWHGVLTTPFETVPDEEERARWAADQDRKALSPAAAPGPDDITRS